MITIDINGNNISCSGKQDIPSGTVGLRAQFNFDSSWDDLTKVVVWTAGPVQVDTVLDGNNQCVIPWECCSYSGSTLYVAVSGTHGEEVVKPTLYAEVGFIKAGAHPLNPANPQTAPLINLILERANDAEATAQSVRADADAGAFDGEKGDKGDRGEKGEPGNDGISPTVEISEIEGGHEITITDRDGTHTANVMDGKDLANVVFETAPAGWNQGGISIATGTVNPSTPNRCISDKFSVKKGGGFVITPNGMEYNFGIYKPDGTFLPYKNAWSTAAEPVSFAFDYDAEYIVMVRFNDNRNITPADVTASVEYDKSKVDEAYNNAEVFAAWDAGNDIKTAAPLVWVDGWLLENGDIYEDISENENRIVSRDVFTDISEIIVTANNGTVIRLKEYDETGAPLQSTNVTAKAAGKHAAVTGKYCRVAVYATRAEAEAAGLKVEFKQDFSSFCNGIVKRNTAEKGLPSYYVDNVSNAIERFETVKNGIIGDSFVFLTDQHVKSNAMHSGLILEYLAANTDCSKVFSGGDISVAYSADGSVETLKGYVKAWLDSMRGIKGKMQYYGSRGNHDMYMYTSSTLETKYELPYSGAYGAICGNNGPVTKSGPAGSMYYAIDNEKEKVRYIVLDTSDTTDTWEDCRERVRLTNAQLQWLAETLLEVEAGWTIVVFGHVPAASGMVGFPQNVPASIESLTLLGDMLKDYKNRRQNVYRDFTDAHGELACYICGHQHIDQSVIEDGMLFIAATCDSMAQKELEDMPDVSWTRTRNTCSEQALDLFAIDTQRKKLYAFRIGAGGYGDETNGITPATVYDREWSY